MELRKYLPRMTEHLFRGLRTSQLELMGFSRQQIADCCRIKALYQQGIYHEATPEQKRLVFVRWLYQQNRLQS
jgi:hypothetical protein